ncbi:MAG: protein kinase [Verrucomicrobiales bacterium]|nr:protein kinase [Verrucomicrobiales bacterium]
MSERYQIKEKIGQGGLGAVYRAVDSQLKREVALKRLLPPEDSEASLMDSDAAEQLLKEATTLSALQHPNIVTVYDVGKDAQGAFVVMEFLKGETFDKTVERGALTEKDFRNVVLQTMEALSAAHHAGVVHRDLKPSNLMVNWLPSGKFQIKILDFGLAKFSRQPAAQTIDQGDAILGSIYFMAPEQFERAPLDARTDLYSIGALYHYCLTGKYPFDGESAPQVMAAHLQNRVTPLAKLRPDLPEWMSDWVMWLISLSPSDRPAGAQDALDRFQAGQPAMAGAPAQLAPPNLNLDPSGAPVVVSPVLADAPAQAALPKPLPVAGGAQTTPLSNMPSGEIPKAQLTTPLAGEGEGMAPAQPGSRRLPLPMWAMITIPVVLIVLGGVIWKFNSDKKEKRIRDTRIATLNTSEQPQGTVEDVTLLIEFIQEQESKGGEVNDNNVSAALTTLQKLEGTGVDRAIVDRLPKVSPMIRAGLISIIAARGNVSAVPTLVNYINDKDRDVSDIAIYALGELGNRDNVTMLITALEDPASQEIRNALVSAIIRISRKIADVEKRSIAIRDALKGASSSGDLRMSLLFILGHLGGEQAWADLKKVLVGSNAAARKEALRGLGSWPDGKPAETIYRIARNQDEDKVIQALALRTYTFLLGNTSELPDEKKVERIGELLATEGGRPGDKIDLLGVLATLASPEALELADSFSGNASFANYGKMASKDIAASLSKVVEANGGDVSLDAARALVFGEGGFEYEESAGAIIRWSNPGYHAAWPVKFSTPGKYDILVNAATPEGGGGAFEVKLAGRVNPVKTGAGDKFEEVPAGSVDIQEAGTYRLVVIGVKIDVPGNELMQLRGVTLKAQ